MRMTENTRRVSSYAPCTLPGPEEDPRGRCRAGVFGRARVVAVLLLLGLAGTAAGGGLVVRPAHVDLVSTRERGASARLLVTGTSAGTTRFRVRVEDFVLSGDGSPERREGVSGARSVRPYLLVDPAEATVDGRNAATILVHASLPPDAAGSYWALIVIEGEPAPVEAGGREVRVAARLLVPLTVRAEGTGRALLAEPSLDAVRTKGGSCSVRLSVANPGDVALRPAASLTIFARRDGGSVEISRQEIPEFLSLPGLARTFDREAPCGEPGMTGVGVYAVVRWGEKAAERIEGVAAVRDAGASP